MTSPAKTRNGKARIRLLHILTTLDVGGAEKKVLSVASRLPRDRYDVSVAWLKGRGELAPAFREAGIATHSLGMDGLFDFRVIRRALRLVRDGKPHVVHTHLMKADATGALVARLSAVPVLVSTKHNEDQYLRFPPFAVGARVAAGMADRVVVISSAVGRFFRRRILLPEEHMIRIPYGFPPHGLGPARGVAARTDLQRELTLPKDAKVVTCVGRLTRQKGLFDLLRAASLTREALPEARFLLVGRGELLPALRAQASRLHLDSRVRFLGFRSDVPRILAGSHVLALPSHWEGFGVVLVEAMSAGLPVVGTRAGAIPEVVADGETGLLAPAGDPQGLATALVRLLANPELAERMGQAGRSRVAREFAIDREVKAHRELYEGLLREKLPPMKVLLVTRAGIGGAARHVLDVVRGLAGRHEIVAAASPLEDASFPDRLEEAGARVVRVPMRRGPRPVSDHRGLAAIRGILAGERFDVVHAHTAKAGALARRAAAGEVPTIYSPHGFFHLYPTAPWPLRRAFLAAERWLGRRTTLLAACAEWEAARAVADGIVPEGSTTVVPNGIDIPEPLAPEDREAVRRELGVPPGGRLVLMAGRLKEPKDPRTFLSAATRFGPETVFGLAGDGPLLAACRRDAPPNARILGDRADVPRLLLAADAAVLASRFEAAPYFLLEAMAAGLPVAATDLPATREMLGDAGVLTPGGDNEALAAAVRLLLQEPGRGDLARARAQSNYSVAGMLAATEAAWARAVGA